MLTPTRRFPVARPAPSPGAPVRTRARARLAQALALGALLAPTLAAAQTALSPAQQVFNRVNELLRREYGGLSNVDRVALGAEYQLRLDAVCAPAPDTCAESRAYPVIEAQLTALDDEHTYFQTPDEFSDFVATLTGGERRQFGVKLAALDGETRVVTEVVPGSVAEEAGLRRGDVLLQINGEPYTFERLREARLSGEPIELSLTRLGVAQTLTLSSRETTTRDLPRLSFVDAPAGPTKAGAGPVAVLRIPTFLAGGGVAQRVHDLVAEAQGRGASGLVVDLRGNGGGNLAECDSAVSAFVPSLARISRSAEGQSRLVVSRGTRVEDGQPAGSVRRPRLWTGPLSVLVDGASASCSEFFAYEIQYARRGPVIGEATAGVGNTATRVFEVGEGALQLTILNYVKPDGTPYPLRVTPDELYEQGEEQIRQLTLGRDVLLAEGLRALQSAPTLSLDALRGRP